MSLSPDLTHAHCSIHYEYTYTRLLCYGVGLGLIHYLGIDASRRVTIAKFVAGEEITSELVYTTEYLAFITHQHERHNVYASLIPRPYLE